MTISVQNKMTIQLLLLIGFVCVLASCASTGRSPEQGQSQATNAQSRQVVAAKSAEIKPVAGIKNAKTLVILPVTFKQGIHVNDVVREQCMLPEKLSGFVRDNAMGQYENIIVDTDRAPSGADVLEIQIIQLLAPKGGGWSGPKFVTVKGTLKRNAQVIGNFEGRRTSTGGMFGAFKGTCAILGRCTKTLGSDIATWLQNPRHNSTLGQ